VFLALCICKLGAAAVSSSMDAVQPQVIVMILQQVWCTAGYTAVPGEGTG
jgi:hypothetical protein